MLFKSSKKVEVTLSAKGLGNIPRNVDRRDFRFIVGDLCYECGSMSAAFLSPRIGSLQSIDPTIQEFVIQTKDPHEYFARIFALCSGLSLSVDFEDCSFVTFLKGICTEFENRELYECLFGRFKDELTISNVADRIRFLHEIHENYESELSFYSSHFFEIDCSFIFSLPIEVFSGIVSNISLRLKDEDSLYSMIYDCFVRDSCYFALFEHIRYEYLSTETMKSFICLIEKSFDFLSFPIWRSLSRRLSLPVSINLSTKRFIDQLDSVSCHYSGSELGSFDGIISYLTKKHCGHVVDRDVISITASSVASAQTYRLHLLVDFQSQTGFATKDLPNSWICYDFKSLRINLTDYSIQARRDYNGNHLRSWTLEGSIDGQSWIEFDRRENDTSLNIQGAIGTFSISSSTDCRYTRVRQLGKNSSGNDYLAINAIEFFGKVTIPKK
jgi:hypothetical protein